MTDREIIEMTFTLLDESFNRNQIIDVIMHLRISEPTDTQLVQLMENGYGVRKLERDDNNSIYALNIVDGQA